MSKTFEPNKPPLDTLLKIAGSVNNWKKLPIEENFFGGIGPGWQSHTGRAFEAHTDDLVIRVGYDYTRYAASLFGEGYHGVCRTYTISGRELPPKDNLYFKYEGVSLDGPEFPGHLNEAKYDPTNANRYEKLKMLYRSVSRQHWKNSILSFFYNNFQAATHFLSKRKY